jgi:hypothetical protein
LLDLANPADPRIAGELEIPGFSEFLHPVTQDLLLGLGAEAGNTKLALFDVSQIGQPQAIPATVAQLPSNGVYVTPLSSLHQFEVLGKQSAGSASLQAAGVVTPPFAGDSERFASISRSFIHGDTVYYVRDGVVWSTSWFAPSQVQGPF